MSNAPPGSYAKDTQSFPPGGGLVFSSLGLCRNNCPFGIRAAPGWISGFQREKRWGIQENIYDEDHRAVI